jgi:NADPH:quinone reductase-like Zn-dependent oxidoreductase
VRAALIQKYGGEVTLAEVPTPEPGPGDLLVRVKAASVNPVDAKIRDGKLKPLLRYRFPLTLGNDLAGEVVAVGSRVARFKAGDAIYARLDKDRIGAFADFALVREAAAAHKPAKASFEEAASIALVGLTAWQALREIGNVSRGHKVLLHAGSGGVGTFAIQLAHHLGATVYTTVGARNFALVKSLGADVLIDYKNQRFEEVVADADLVLDTQGGETLLRSFAAVRPGGVVVSIGGMPDAKFGRAWGVNPFFVLAFAFLSRGIARAAKRRGARYEFLFLRPSGDQLGEIARLYDAGALKAVVDRTFPLAEIREALAYSEAGHAVGKVVVTP